jgi:hypothetical protein
MKRKDGGLKKMNELLLAPAEIPKKCPLWKKCPFKRKCQKPWVKLSPPLCMAVLEASKRVKTES